MSATVGPGLTHVTFRPPMPSRPAVPRGGLARLAAAIALAALPLHVLMAAAGHHGPLLTVVMLAMAGWCALCSLHIWRARPQANHRTPVLHLWAMAAAMAVLHALLLAGPPGLTTAHLNHGGTGSASALSAHADSAALMIGIIVVELSVALICALSLRRFAASPRTSPWKDHR